MPSSISSLPELHVPSCGIFIAPIKEERCNHVPGLSSYFYFAYIYNSKAANRTDRVNLSPNIHKQTIIK
jgi:hypothetical protein